MHPQNKIYRKSVRHFHDATWLEVEAWLDLVPLEHFSFSVRIVSILAGEEKLDSGRFSLFSKEAQPHLVDININHEWESYGSVFPERLNWISENVTDLWGFDVDIPHLGRNAECTLTFSFKNRSDAILFKLSF